MDEKPSMLPQGTSAASGDDPMKAMRAFARDQVEAVKIAREENDGSVKRSRIDACYLAMQFLDNLNGGTQGAHTVESVIATARKFEKYLTE